MRYIYIYIYIYIHLYFFIVFCHDFFDWPCNIRGINYGNCDKQKMAEINRPVRISFYVVFI